MGISKGTQLFPPPSNHQKPSGFYLKGIFIKGQWWDSWIPRKITALHSKLVGGWTNPSEKYESKWESIPKRGEIKHIWNHHRVFEGWGDDHLGKHGETETQNISWEIPKNPRRQRAIGTQPRVFERSDVLLGDRPTWMASYSLLHPGKLTWFTWKWTTGRGDSFFGNHHFQVPY